MIHDGPLLLLNDFARARLSPRCPLPSSNRKFNFFERCYKSDDSFERIDQIRDEWRVIGEDLVWDKFYSFAQVEIVARLSHDAIDRSRFLFSFRGVEIHVLYDSRLGINGFSDRFESIFDNLEF